MAQATLSSARAQRVLARLYKRAKAVDPPALARTNPITNAMHGEEKFRVRSEMLKEAALPVPPEVGRLIYMIARASHCKRAVEFGTSLGISTIHIAAAIRDNGGGRMIATELNPEKAGRAMENLRAAGLADLVELRVGDARKPLRSVKAPVDFVLLDGWKELYLPVLKIIEPKLSEGAFVVADNLNIAGDNLRSFVQYVSEEKNGYVSLPIPIGDRLELSLRVRKR